MNRRALALVAVAVAGLAVAGLAVAGPKRGRIVRIERPRTGSTGLPRMCRLNDPASAICWVKFPAKGELGWVVGPDTNGNPGNRGQISVGEITATDGNCSSPTYWNFTVQPLSANMNNVESWSTWVLFDVEVGPDAKAVEPSLVKDPPDPKNSPWVAIDRGRPGEDPGADFVVTAYQCDEHGTASTSSSPGGYCLDYWVRSTTRWSLIRHDIASPPSPCTP